MSGAKINVGVLFGGRSAEHEVSLVSATSIMNALDRNKYRIVPIGIAPDGKWYSSADVMKLLKEGKTPLSSSEITLLPDPSKKSLLNLHSFTVHLKKPHLDVIFPVLHGTFGEDGTVQGLLELTGIPYVGAGVLGSAAAMDKVVTKQLCEYANIPVVPYVWFLGSAYRRSGRKLISKIESALRYPCFVKPANLGSSVGISKAHNRRELIAAISLASRYDMKILVEKSIEHAHEIEVSLLGNDEPCASLPGEIISSNEFYDYDAKYVDGKSTAIIPANLPPRILGTLQEIAVRSFIAVNCSGMARADFLVAKRSGKIYLNEINTIPGFTSISMYPKLWEASGIPYPKLLDKLIDLALARHAQKKYLKTTFRPRRNWYTG